MPLLHIMLTILAIAWASPWSLLGLLIGTLGLAGGGAVTRSGRVLEFHGGTVLRGLLRWVPLASGATAMTLGHTILARSKEDAETTRAHELVHVRQYERWGLFFVPAYLCCSTVLWCQGQDPYLDNPFERQAYQRSSMA